MNRYRYGGKGKEGKGRGSLVVIHNRDRIDRPVLHDRPVPDCAHIEILAFRARFDEVIMQRRVEHAELSFSTTPRQSQHRKVELTWREGDGEKENMEREESERTCVPRLSKYAFRSSRLSFQNSPTANIFGLFVCSRTVLMNSAMKPLSMC